MVSICTDSKSWGNDTKGIVIRRKFKIDVFIRLKETISGIFSNFYPANSQPGAVRYVSQL
jgi:hypothetical protein